MAGERPVTVERMHDVSEAGLGEVRLGFADELVRAVGVSHYQEPLRRVSGAGLEGPVRHQVRAALAPEPENPHDPNAVTVRVEGELVGYLSREDAVRYGPVVRLLGEHGGRLTCDATIGRRGADGGTSNLGVFIELPRPVEALLEAETIVRGRS